MADNKNQNVQSRLLQSITKYASKPLGFDRMFLEEKTLKKREVEYASSLPLQIIIFFNSYFSLCWAIGTCFLWPTLVYVSTEDSRVWIILILFAFILMVIFELIRLYLGFVGNLSERVPELTGFWLLTLMVELPLSSFLIAIVWVNLGNVPLRIAYLLPMQFALELFHAIFVYLEVIFGFFALRVLARYQISRFHYKQFDQNNLNFKNDDDNDLKDSDWLTNLEKTNNYKMKDLNFDSKNK